MSGEAPIAFAGHYSQGQQAVMAVIFRVVKRSGQCRLSLERIGKIAGVSVSTVQITLRTAKANGHLKIDRPHPRGKVSISMDLGWIDAAGRRVEALSSRGMHTTSDFPILLQAAGNRALLQRYEPLASPLKSLSAQRNARDFRQQSFVRPGEAPLLEKVLESGEIKSGTTSEDSRGLKIDTYGKMFNISRQALVNDDLGAFSDFLGVFAQSAAETEGNLFASLLLSNEKAGIKLGDDKPLFHTDRKNIGAPADITVDSVGFARMAMRTHKNVNGTGTAGVVPAVLLVGPSQETDAEKLVASIPPNSSPKYRIR